MIFKIPEHGKKGLGQGGNSLSSGHPNELGGALGLDALRKHQPEQDFLALHTGSSSSCVVERCFTLGVPALGAIKCFRTLTTPKTSLNFIGLVCRCSAACNRIGPQCVVCLLLHNPMQQGSSDAAPQLMYYCIGLL